MKMEKLLRDIELDLETYLAHIKRLKKKEKEIHQLDVDLLLENTRKLYDKILGLEHKTIRSHQTIVLPETMPEAEIPEVAFSTHGISPGPLVVEEKVEEKIEVEKLEPEVEGKAKVEAKAKEKTEERPVVREKGNEVVIEKIEEKEDVETKVESKKEASSTTSTGTRRMENYGDPIGFAPGTTNDDESAIEHPTIAKNDEPTPSSRTTFDLFSSDAEETIADKLGKQDDASVAERMQKSHIADLRQAIGINEKFLFINELFNGDLGRYNKAIDEFNELTSQQGIDTYLLEIKIHNQWPDDSDAYIKLKTLLDRKFS